MTNINELLDKKYGKKGTLTRALFEIETLIMLRNETQDIKDEVIIGRITKAIVDIKDEEVYDYIIKELF